MSFLPCVCEHCLFSVHPRQHQVQVIHYRETTCSLALAPDTGPSPMPLRICSQTQKIGMKTSKTLPPSLPNSPLPSPASLLSPSNEMSSQKRASFGLFLVAFQTPVSPTACGQVPSKLRLSGGKFQAQFVPPDLSHLPCAHPWTAVGVRGQHPNLPLGLCFTPSSSAEPSQRSPTCPPLQLTHPVPGCLLSPLSEQSSG